MNTLKKFKKFALTKHQALCIKGKGSWTCHGATSVYTASSLNDAITWCELPENGCTHCEPLNQASVWRIM